MTNRKKAALLLCLSLMLGGCGYTLSPSPYGLLTAMTISVPVVKNQSSYGNLGPLLTSDIITRLDASSNIKVREGAPASLIMTIQTVSISGGAWTPSRNNDIPTNSASRVIYLTVEAVLERPNPDGGQPLVRRHVFDGTRNFHVSDRQEQVELSQNEAFEWLIDDLSQKIAQTMFSEF
ncbi:MAG: LPS assembly lipoprotein LptE [Candidatus Adiutrix sp.]|jgi:hypothetical protein|nr:LPS assembly lipoprotein LptE [Candidatus Adiutrix sp.]